jgi:hypothetical protein
MAETAPGPYVTFSMPPLAAAELLDELVEQQRKPLPPPPGRRLRWGLALAMLALGAAGWAVDDALGVRPGVFGALAPLAWTGALVVLGAARARRPDRAAGCVVVLLLGVLMTVLGGVALLVGVHAPGAMVLIASVAVILYGLWRERRDRPAAPTDPRHRITPWAEILRALADDADPGKPAVGVLDLTGGQKPEKLVRSGKALSGAAVSVYRDEWWRLQQPLRDGSRLRLSAVDRWKVRAEHWKQGSRRRKLKPGRAERLMTVEVRLAPNPQRYRTRTADGGSRKLGALQVSPLLVGDGRVTAIGQLLREEDLSAGDVLALVAHAFSALEPAAGR